MKKIIPKLAVIGLLAATIAVAPTQMSAQEKKEAPAAEKKHAPKRERGLPFHGKVTALDKTAKTVTVGKRVFHITSATRIVKNGKPATLNDGAVGDEVGGSYTKSDDGKLTAKMLRFGPKPEGKAKGTHKKKKQEQ